MLKFIKSIFYKRNISEGIQYEDIDIQIDKIFKSGSSSASSVKKLAPSKDLERNKSFIRRVFDKCDDVVIREINIMSDSRYKAACIYVSNMIPSQYLEEGVISKLTNTPENYLYISNIEEYCISSMGIDRNKIIDDLKKTVESIVNGEVVIFINGISRVMPLDMKNPPSRPIEAPPTESVIRGSREGFTESHGSNVCLIRKKIKSPNLKTETFKVGKQTATNVTMVYMSNIANKNIVDEVRNRINKIEIDSIVAASYIEEYIEDSPLSLLPTIFRTEKPDVAAAKLLEGRVVIIIDTVPVTLTLPTMFGEFLMAPDDYYLRFYTATLNRWIRLLAFFLSLTMPGAFVSLVTYHQELLPTSLVISIIRSRTNIPFPPMFEAFFMLLTYMILQEADIRLPKTMGQAVSVVGGLVLGQAAISAGIVSAHMIIVVAFSAVAALAVPTPELQMPLAYIRLLLLVLGGIGGMVGLTCGLIILIIHMLSLRSFGVPYLAPVGPLKPKELKDVLIRAPLWTMKNRPKTVTWSDTVRRKDRPTTNPITENQKLEKGQ